MHSAANRLLHAVRDLFWALCCAISFMTIVPIQRLCPHSAISSCGWLFPFVGFLIGALIATGDQLAMVLMPVSTTSAISVAMLALITGGLHLDGLADLADAIGSGKDARGQLEIMREAHIGAFGAASICVVLLLKYALMISLEPACRWTAICLMPMLGRYGAVLSMFLFPYARPNGGIASNLRERRIRQFVGATIYTAISALLCGASAGVVALLLCTAISSLTSVLLSTKLGGLTGDCYGAIIEVCEVASLLCFSVL